MNRKRTAAWLAAVLCAGALAGCGAAQGPSVAAHREAWRAAGSAPARPRATWLINPDERLPRGTPWWQVLAVARRFAVADLSYEIGQLGPAVRRTIMATCTAAFAAGLFAHRASLPPGVSPRQVSQRLVRVEPLERIGRSAVVLASLRSNGRGEGPGAFELRLVSRPGGWRVAGLSVV